MTLELRDNPSGQIALGGQTKKLSVGEVGFSKGGGIPSLSCSDCRYFVQGTCWQVDVQPAVDDLCDEFQPSLGGGHIPSNSGQTLAQMSGVQRQDLYITRVAADPRTGQRRWFATSSGTKKDAYGEYMTVGLFKDFLERILRKETAPEVFASKAWTGGNPYLGVAHYLDQEGGAIVGDTEKVYIDGDVFKAKGTFRDTLLAKKSYDAIRQDIELNRPADERVRISIAFVDFAHDHQGVGQFIRKTLADRCDLCERGVGEKRYQKGLLVHLALTRRPAYAETAILLEERSMTTKRDDAASIVGDELADELENKSKTLTARSEGIDPSAVVIKAEDKAVLPTLGDTQPASPPEAPVEQTQRATGTSVKDQEDRRQEELAEVERHYLGGAMSLDAAEKFLSERADKKPVLLDSWGILAGVLSNIATSRSADKPTAIRQALGDFQSNLDVMTARALTGLHDLIAAKAQGGEEVENETKKEEEKEEAPAEMEDEKPESEEEEKKKAENPFAAKHLLNDALLAFRAAYDKAMALPTDSESKLVMLQPAMDALGDVVLRSVHGVSKQAEPAPTTDGSAPSVPAMTPDAVASIVDERVVQRVAEQVAPLKAMLEAALAARAAEPVARAAAPQPRALRPVQLAERSTAPSSRPSSLRSAIRRSVGIND